MSHEARDEVVWHTWEPWQRVLKVAFVSEESVTVVTYRMCLDCGVSMEREESDGGFLWRCSFCGAQIAESPGQ